MDTSLLDTLVKLASAGTSGVCILAIFWTGICLQRLPADATVERHRSLRYFMTMCALVALVSATAACVSGYFNYRQIVQLKGSNEALVQNKDELTKKLDQSQMQIAELDARYLATAKHLEQERAQLASLSRDRSAWEYAKRNLIAELASVKSEYSKLQNDHKTVLHKLRIKPKPNRMWR